MPITNGTFATENGSKYLQQLCKHFGHKRPVEFTPEAGRMEFGFGLVELQADAAGLNIKITLADEADPENAQDVIDRHLARFAFREEFTAMNWTLAGDGEA